MLEQMCNTVRALQSWAREATRFFPGISQDIYLFKNPIIAKINPGTLCSTG